MPENTAEQAFVDFLTFHLGYESRRRGETKKAEYRRVISIAQARTTVLISIETKMHEHMLLRATAELHRSNWKPRKMKGLS